MAALLSVPNQNLADEAIAVDATGVNVATPALTEVIRAIQLPPDRPAPTIMIVLFTSAEVKLAVVEEIVLVLPIAPSVAYAPSPFAPHQAGNIASTAPTAAIETGPE